MRHTTYAQRTFIYTHRILICGMWNPFIAVVCPTTMPPIYIIHYMHVWGPSWHQWRMCVRASPFVTKKKEKEIRTVRVWITRVNEIMSREKNAPIFEIPEKFRIPRTENRELWNRQTNYLVLSVTKTSFSGSWHAAMRTSITFYISVSIDRHYVSHWNESYKNGREYDMNFEFDCIMQATSRMPLSTCAVAVAARMQKFQWPNDRSKAIIKNTKSIFPLPLIHTHTLRFLCLLPLLSSTVILRVVCVCVCSIWIILRILL